MKMYFNLEWFNCKCKVHIYFIARNKSDQRRRMGTIFAYKSQIFE